MRVSAASPRRGRARAVIAIVAAVVNYVPPVHKLLLLIPLLLWRVASERLDHAAEKALAAVEREARRHLAPLGAPVAADPLLVLELR